jgi:hypothetical protein
MRKLLSSLLIAAVAACLVTLPAPAADKKPAPEEKKGEKKGPNPIPFRGKISAVDKAAKTVTVGERKFHVLATTKVNKAGKPATLDDAVVGEDVGGAYLEGEGGRLELRSLRLGPPAKKPKPEEKKPVAN